MKELGAGSNPLQVAVGAAETVIGQALALTKTPLDLLRGSGGAEKVLKNAKDAAATEALEIATYTAIERLAKDLGDDKTAQLAASIRADEERMLARVLREIPTLTAGVLDGNAYAVSETGAGEAVQAAAKATKRAARQARKVPGVAQAEGQVKGAVAVRGRPGDRPLRAAHRRRDRRSGCRSSRRSTSPRSTSTSAATTTARPCSTASPRCAATSRGPDTTS